MIDPIGTWISTYSTLPSVIDISWAANIADWMYQRVQAAQLTDVSSAMPFPFAKSVFQAQLQMLVPTIDQLGAITAYANAWETAIIASQPLIVVAGDSTTGGTWSVVSSAIINPGSIAAAKAVVMTLATAAYTSDASLSQYPRIMRDAFLTLKGDVVGLDTSGPPVPLLAMGKSFI